MSSKRRLIILVFDYNPLTNLDKEILEMTSRSTRITVINKNDLEPRIDLSLFDDYLLMSTFNPEDIEKLERKIKNVAYFRYFEIDYTYLGNAGKSRN